MALSEATKANLRRKSEFIDQVWRHPASGVPMWSWVDLSITELCNKTCPFCPRADSEVYPNQRLHMPLALASKIANELKELDYHGAVVLCGFGEPTLHPQLDVLVAILATARTRIELVTNGDFLTSRRIRDLASAGLGYFVVSMYDGPHQVAGFKEMFAEAGLDEERWFTLRDRWHSEEDGFGLKLTNRAGTVSVGLQEPVDVHHPCFYNTYQLTIDWNGDVLLCPQDWSKKIKFGNLALQSMSEVWTSPALHKRRMQLIKGRRTASPCNVCNCDGTLHGFNHAPAWLAK